MQYVIDEQSKNYLEEIYKFLNEIEVKGGKNISPLFGSILRIEEIIKRIKPLEEVSESKNASDI